MGGRRAGLGLEEALERWSVPSGYEAMREYWDARQVVRVAKGVEPPPRVLRHQEYARRRQPLEVALEAKLAAAELAASVLPPVRGPQTSRVVVRPATFQEAVIEWDLEEIVGLNLRLESPEIFDPRQVPLNVWIIPDWYADAFSLTKAGAVAQHRSEGFHSSANYRHVELGGLSFSLSVAQARAVRHLHEALVKGDPWVPTRDLLGQRIPHPTRWRTYFAVTWIRTGRC